MSKVDRELINVLGRITLLTTFYWMSIGTAIFGAIEISIFTTIGYVVSVIFIESAFFGRTEPLKKRVIVFFACCALLIVPYALVLVIRSLIG